MELLKPREAIKRGLVPFKYDLMLRALQSGEMKHIKIKNRYYVREDWIEEYLKKYQAK